MDLQNLAYALTQVAHNFGAVVVVAAPLYALWAARPVGVRGVLWLVLSGFECLDIVSSAIRYVAFIHPIMNRSFMMVR